MTLLALLLGCGEATLVAPDQPGPDGHRSPGVTALDPLKDRWKLDDPWLVPNSPSPCTGVALAIRADPACTRAPGHLVGLGDADGQCLLNEAEGGPLWTVQIESPDFRGDVHCATERCSSPPLRIADPGATPDTRIVGGTWLAAEPRGSGDGSQSLDCAEAAFPGARIHLLLPRPDALTTPEAPPPP